MFACIHSAAITGVTSTSVVVEADVSDGLPSFHMVGDLGTQVREAYDRVLTAFRSIGMRLPSKRITINITPANLRKEGTRFDLPIAAAVLTAMGKISPSTLSQTMVLGELRLNGQIQGVSGVFPSVLAGMEKGCKTCIVPAENAAEAKIAGAVQVIGVHSLAEFIEYCRSGQLLFPTPEREEPPQTKLQEDFSEVYGQESVKRAALIAAAGFHNLLLCGPPGTGKSMTARRIPGILPELDEAEKLEITKIYSIAGLLNKQSTLLHTRPFRAPHYTVSGTALAGGGRVPKPGEITLAHKGVLFLDELPEMAARTLEVLRQPLEEQKIVISRMHGSCTFPADFLLIAAMNPCPCGYYPDYERCRCTPGEIHRYQSKISRPLLDRMDLCVQVPEISYEHLQKRGGDCMDSDTMRTKVIAAQGIQRERLREIGAAQFQFNSRLENRLLEKICILTSEGEQILKRVYESMKMSARGYYRILRTARTIADLEGSEKICSAHLGEAICYRNTEEADWRKE